MKVLVTGGAGFIGSHLVERLIHEKTDVVIIDYSPHLCHMWKDHPVKVYQLSLLDGTLRDIFAQERPQIIVHLAAQTSVEQSIAYPVLDAQTNVIGTTNLLQCAVEYNVKKIVFASTAAVYGEPQYLPIHERHPICPIAFYGLSKYVSELYIQQYAKLFDLTYSILRFSNVYGPRQTADGEGGVISIFLNRIIEEKPLTIFGDGEQTRDFIFVDDIVRACMKAMTLRESNILNISSHTELSINTLVAISEHQINHNIQRSYKSAKPGDIKRSCLDHSLAVQTLKWKPKYTIEEGIEKTFSHMLEHHHF